MKMKNLETIPDPTQPYVRTKRVSVREHEVHDEMWNDLIVVTGNRLLKQGRQPDGLRGCIYLNPGFTVKSSEFSREFTREARRCQRAWIRTMNKTLGNSNRRESARTSDYMTRQLRHNGVLMINGTIIAPHDWTSMERDLQVNEMNDEGTPPPEFIASPRHGPGLAPSGNPAGAIETSIGDRHP